MILLLAGVAGGATILAGFLIAWCALALRDDETEVVTGGAHA